MIIVELVPGIIVGESCQGVAKIMALSKLNMPALTTAVSVGRSQALLKGLKVSRLFTSMIANKINTLTAPI